MENNLRVLLCGVFILFSCEYAAGAKKKKELETIVEVCEELKCQTSFIRLNYW